jgi:uncharacterized protein with PQ loop repeat
MLFVGLCCVGILSWLICGIVMKNLQQPIIIKLPVVTTPTTQCVEIQDKIINIYKRFGHSFGPTIECEYYPNNVFGIDFLIDEYRLKDEPIIKRND